MAKEGTQIIIFHPGKRAVLMYLRDDFAHIDYPNHWALLGGMLEAGETTKDCVIREIVEEIGVELDPTRVEHFATNHRDFGIEHTFVTTLALDIDNVTLTEGQGLSWFTESEAAKTRLGYADNEILEQFFAGLPTVHDATR